MLSSGPGLGGVGGIGVTDDDEVVVESSKKSAPEGASNNEMRKIEAKNIKGKQTQKTSYKKGWRG